MPRCAYAIVGVHAMINYFYRDGKPRSSILKRVIRHILSQAYHQARVREELRKMEDKIGPNPLKSVTVKPGDLK